MSDAFAAALDDLLAPSQPPIGDLARVVIDTVREVRPDMKAKVQPGWRSVNFTHPKAKFVCGVFPQIDDVILIFHHGRELDSPLLEDNGKVNRVRWIRFRPGDAIPVDDLAILLAEAIALRS